MGQGSFIIMFLKASIFLKLRMRNCNNNDQITLNDKLLLFSITVKNTNYIRLLVMLKQTMGPRNMNISQRKRLYSHFIPLQQRQICVLYAVCTSPGQWKVGNLSDYQAVVFHDSFCGYSPMCMVISLFKIRLSLSGACGSAVFSFSCAAFNTLRYETPDNG